MTLLRTELTEQSQKFVGHIAEGMKLLRGLFSEADSVFSSCRENMGCLTLFLRRALILFESACVREGRP